MAKRVKLKAGLAVSPGPRTLQQRAARVGVAAYAVRPDKAELRRVEVDGDNVRDAVEQPVEHVAAAGRQHEQAVLRAELEHLAVDARVLRRASGGRRTRRSLSAIARV